MIKDFKIIDNVDTGSSNIIIGKEVHSDGRVRKVIEFTESEVESRLPRVIRIYFDDMADKNVYDFFECLSEATEIEILD